MNEQNRYSSEFLLNTKLCDKLTSQKIRYTCKISSNRFSNYPQLSYSDGNISDILSNSINEHMISRIAANPLFIVTHSGRFHADEILAVSTVCAAFNSNYHSYTSTTSFKNNYNVSDSIDTFGPVVIRTRSKENISELRSKNEPVIVFDIGGEFDADKLLFDHHQKNGAGSRDCRDYNYPINQEIEYATFGLAWKYFANTVIAKTFWDMLNYRVKTNNPLFSSIVGIKYKRNNLSSRRFEIDDARKVVKRDGNDFVGISNFIGKPYRSNKDAPLITRNELSVAGNLFCNSDVLRYVSFIRKICKFVQTQCKPDEKFSNLISSLDWKKLESYIIAANAVMLHKFDEILSIITEEVFCSVEDFLVAPIDMNDVGDKRSKARYSVYNFSSIVAEYNESKDLDKQSVMDYIDCFGIPADVTVGDIDTAAYNERLASAKTAIYDASNDNSFSHVAEIGFNLIRSFVSKSILEAIFVVSDDHFTVYDDGIVEIHNNELSLRWNSMKDYFPSNTKFIVVQSLSSSDDDDESSKITYRAYSFNKNTLFPTEWWGIPTGELRKISGCDTATFCHQTGFTIGADSREDIMNMCKIASRGQDRLSYNSSSNKPSRKISIGFNINEEDRLAILAEIEKNK